MIRVEVTLFIYADVWNANWYCYELCHAAHLNICSAAFRSTMILIVKGAACTFSSFSVFFFCFSIIRDYNKIYLDFFVACLWWLPGRILSMLLVCQHTNLRSHAQGAFLNSSSIMHQLDSHQCNAFVTNSLSSTLNFKVTFKLQITCCGEFFCFYA